MNTGWIGGPYGIGKRIAIQETRKMVRAILADAMDGSTFRKDPQFGFEVPLSCPAVDAKLLQPRDLWSDPEAYDKSYKSLGEQFQRNFAQFRDLVTPEVAAAGP